MQKAMLQDCDTNPHQESKCQWHRPQVRLERDGPNASAHKFSDCVWHETRRSSALHCANARAARTVWSSQHDFDILLISCWRSALVANSAYMQMAVGEMHQLSLTTHKHTTYACTSLQHAGWMLTCDLRCVGRRTKSETIRMHIMIRQHIHNDRTARPLAPYMYVSTDVLVPSHVRVGFQDSATETGVMMT